MGWTKSEKRIRNYQLAVDLGRLGRKSNWRKRAINAYARSAETNVEIERLVKGVLSTEPVPCIEVIWYITYCKVIGKQIRVCHDPEQRDLKIAQATEKWAKRGLKEPIMKRIRIEVFAYHDRN